MAPGAPDSGAARSSGCDCFPRARAARAARRAPGRCVRADGSFGAAAGSATAAGGWAAAASGFAGALVGAGVATTRFTSTGLVCTGLACGGLACAGLAASGCVTPGGGWTGFAGGVLPVAAWVGAVLVSAALAGVDARPGAAFVLREGGVCGTLRAAAGVAGFCAATSRFVPPREETTAARVCAALVEAFGAGLRGPVPGFAAPRAGLSFRAAFFLLLAIGGQYTPDFRARP